MWCPVKGNTHLGLVDQEEMLIATSSVDRSIKIWAIKEGVCLTECKLPCNTGIHRPRPNDKRTTWIPLHWLKEDLILSNGISGELLVWTVGSKEILL